MTIGAWVLWVLIAIAAVGVSWGISDVAYGNGKKGLIIGLVISFVICICMMMYFQNTEDGKRMMKTQESNFSGGISRTVKVYDINGNIITEYNGKFDIDYDENRIIFDDENDKRHIIYYTTGTVVIDEE